MFHTKRHPWRWLLAALVLFLILTRPAVAADWAEEGLAGAGRAADSLITFMTSLGD